MSDRSAAHPERLPLDPAHDQIEFGRFSRDAGRHGRGGTLFTYSAVRRNEYGTFDLQDV
jgi:hypothetical protein